MLACWLIRPVGLIPRPPPPTHVCACVLNGYSAVHAQASRLHDESITGRQQPWQKLRYVSPCVHIFMSQQQFLFRGETNVCCHSIPGCLTCPAWGCLLPMWLSHSSLILFTCEPTWTILRLPVCQVWWLSSATDLSVPAINERELRENILVCLVGQVVNLILT